MKVKVPLIYHEYEFYQKLFCNRAFHSFHKLSETLLSQYNALSEKEKTSTTQILNLDIQPK